MVKPDARSHFRYGLRKSRKLSQPRGFALLYRKPKNVSLFTNGESAGLLLTANAVIAIRILWLAKEKTCWHTISGRGGRIHRMRCLDSKAN